MKKKFIIKVDTNWCGEDNSFAAIAEKESELYDITDELSFSNFSDFGGITAIAEELFGTDDPSDEQLEEIYKVETEYYSSEIEEWDEEQHGEFESYELVYGSLKDIDCDSE